jgi:hypothetical protein
VLIVPVEVLVKFTLSGVVPEVVLAVNWATGATAAAETVM